VCVHRRRTASSPLADLQSRYLDGSEPFRIGNSTTGRSREWISVEIEANTAGNGTITLYIDTQDGRFQGEYLSRPMDDTGGGGQWFQMDILGGYMNRGSSVRGDPENYFMIDELAFSTTRIGPPAGFREGDPPVGPPVVLPAPVLTIR